MSCKRLSQTLLLTENPSIHLARSTFSLDSSGLSGVKSIHRIVDVPTNRPVSVLLAALLTNWDAAADADRFAVAYVVGAPGNGCIPSVGGWIHIAEDFVERGRVRRD